MLALPSVKLKDIWLGAVLPEEADLGNILFVHGESDAVCAVPVDD